MRYRPPIVLEQGEEENRKAFALHFDSEVKKYEHVVAVCLVDLAKRERALADAYIDQMLSYDSPNTGFVSFDFHEYTKGLRFDNIGHLINAIKRQADQMGYFYTCDYGDEIKHIQRGVFRVNCVDCLDRTNVGQGSIAKYILEKQLRRLHLLNASDSMPRGLILAYQHMWADNGDMISKQYAGTGALKSDFTRTGERNILGILQDGYKSANRYVRNTFRDFFRQAAIEVSMGKTFSGRCFRVLCCFGNRRKRTKSRFSTRLPFS